MQQNSNPSYDNPSYYRNNANSSIICRNYLLICKVYHNIMDILIFN